MAFIPLPPGLSQFVSQVGVPAVLALVILVELLPRIDHGIMVADRVDAELTQLAARGCLPVLVPVTP